MYPHIPGVFPERRLPDGPVSGMADICRLSEPVYRALELTEALVYAENVFSFINPANIIIIYSEKAGISAELIVILILLCYTDNDYGCTNDNRNR